MVQKLQERVDAFSTAVLQRTQAVEACLRGEVFVGRAVLEWTLPGRSRGHNRAVRPRPRLVIIGGPNGAGKTTLCERMTAALGLTYLGADQIAAERGLGTTGLDAIRAARLFSGRAAEALARRESMLIESTLSGLTTRRLLATSDHAGYDITVVLVFVDSPEACIARIQTRVARGGHFVPDADVRRRFRRSLRNFWHHYRLQGHRWQLHYNGMEGLVPALRASGGECAMKVSSTASKPRLSEDTQRQLDEMARLSKEAVRGARQGRLTEELPDGSVRPVRSK